MAEDKSFQERVRRISELVEEVESIADPAVRTTTKELMQSLMDMHGAVLERTLEVISETGEPGLELIAQLGRDPIVSSVLVLYGLHPEEVDTRVLRAVEQLKPQLRKQGCEVGALESTEGMVRLTVHTGEHACGSTAKTIRANLEGAIYDAAPDIISLTIVGLDGQVASGFVALNSLMGNSAMAESARLGPGGADQR